MPKIDDALSLLSQIQDYEKYHQIEFYKPYKFQQDFHFARGVGDFHNSPSDLDNKGLATRRALMCANQIGKSFSGGRETGYHLTGLYPDWWDGHKFNHPVEFICSSTTNETTRDRCQRELIGEPSDDDLLGTGAIPKDCLDKDKLTRKAGVPNAWETALVKHHTDGVFDGWSKVYFKPYEQGAKKFMGYKVHGIWDDEEPPSDIWSQQLRALLATDGIAYITFTPEEGVTDVVYTFLDDIKPGYALTQATWSDADHMTPEKIDQKLMDYPPHEREMRSKGIPMMGSGLIYPIPDEDLLVDPFPIPEHWPRLIGVDFGWDHPFAAVWIAEDREQDTVYIYDSFRESKLLIPLACDRLKRGGAEWIPVVWPHDGMIHDKASGTPLADIYREHGINMHPDCFSNPPAPGQKEGQGGQGVEVGVQHILTAMMEGRFKVFSNCNDWFEEKRMYHRNDNKIIKIKDDLMSATRYAYQMRRHAITKLPVVSRNTHRKGLSNW